MEIKLSPYISPKWGREWTHSQLCPIKVKGTLRQVISEQRALKLEESRTSDLFTRSKIEGRLTFRCFGRNLLLLIGEAVLVKGYIFTKVNAPPVNKKEVRSDTAVRFYLE